MIEIGEEQNKDKEREATFSGEGVHCDRENGGMVPLGWGPLNNQPHIHLI